MSQVTRLATGGGGGGGITTISTDNGSSVTGATISISGHTGTIGTLSTFAASPTAINSNYFDANNTLVMGTNQSYAGGPNNGVTDSVIVGANIFQNIFTFAAAGIQPFTQNCLVGSNIFNGYNLGFGASANFNCAFGYNALNQIGSLTLGLQNAMYNCVMGHQAGTNYTAAESNNILLNSPGGNSDNNVLRIGAGTGTGNQQLNSAFISGINGITVTGVAVLVSAGDQLGIAVSSKRYKKNIDDMSVYSENIFKLRPVTFDYKDQSFDDPMVGLIAEEVEEVMPELIHRDKEGLPLTVKYLDLIPMMLNEIQKLRKELNTLKS